MKRFSSSDSLGTMLYSPQDEKAKGNLVYSSEFQAMLDSLDDEGCIEENGHGIGKKRRLSIVQVQALEKIFEVDNKLDPEKKVKLAQELGLQPRQVAIWFQNRRARWKTKQLERDYNLLKADYDNLQLNQNRAEEEKAKLTAELKLLKKKLGEENTEWNHLTGKSTLPSSQNAVSEQFNGCFTELTTKDGSSDSDSSGILSEHNNLITSKTSCSMYYPQFINSRQQMIRSEHQQQQQQHSNLKTEEINLLSLDQEPCNIYSVDQPPNLYWYFPDQKS